MPKNLTSGPLTNGVSRSHEAHEVREEPLGSTVHQLLLSRGGEEHSSSPLLTHVVPSVCLSVREAQLGAGVFSLPTRVSRSTSQFLKANSSRSATPTILSNPNPINREILFSSGPECIDSQSMMPIGPREIEFSSITNFRAHFSRSPECIGYHRCPIGYERV